MSDYKINIFILLLYFCTQIHSQSLFITPLKTVLNENPKIEYMTFQKAHTFEYEQFPISLWPELQPNKGLFAETFILNIPNGQVCSYLGWIKVNNSIIKELMPQNYNKEIIMERLTNAPFRNLKKISGRVAVITTIDAFCYGHWIQDILGRLIILEKSGISYDWIYVPSYHKFQKETLDLWGIDSSKLIEPFDDCYIQADELIVPSYTAHRAQQEFVPYIENLYLVCYFTPWCIEYIKNKFLPLAKNRESQINNNFSKRIFISRKNTKVRRMINEDDVFALFEKKGFTRYFLETMSVLDQIILFKNAEIIVAPNGSGLTNMIFCKPETRIIEIFQARSDCCFYFLAQTIGLKNYQYIKTMEFEDIGGFYDTLVNLDIIQNFVDKFL